MQPRKKAKETTHPSYDTTNYNEILNFNENKEFKPKKKAGSFTIYHAHTF